MKLIDPIDIKQSIKDGQLEAFAARGKVYIKDVKSGDCVKILEELPSAEPNLQPNLQPTCNQLATDCISRQGAIDAVNELTRWYYETFHEKRPTANAVIDKLMDLPSAEPRCIATIHLSQEQLDEAFEKVKADILSVKPKTGKWLIAEKDRYIVHSVRCSVCGYCISWMANYCPDCGSRMLEEGGEDDE